MASFLHDIDGFINKNAHTTNNKASSNSKVSFVTSVKPKPYFSSYKSIHTSDRSKEQEAFTNNFKNTRDMEEALIQYTSKANDINEKLEDTVHQLKFIREQNHMCSKKRAKAKDDYKVLLDMMKQLLVKKEKQRLMEDKKKNLVFKIPAPVVSDLDSDDQDARGDHIKGYITNKLDRISQVLNNHLSNLNTYTKDLNELYKMEGNEEDEEDEQQNVDKDDAVLQESLLKSLASGQKNFDIFDK